MREFLVVKDITMRFGGLVAINEVSFSADKEKITAIIGPNGAGKTTLFNCLTGFYTPTSGEIILNNQNIGHFKGHNIAKKVGIARTFQNIRLFSRMSCLENLLVAQHNALMKASLFSIAGILSLSSYKNKEKEAIEFAKYWLDKINITPYANMEAGNLPYGLQRKLEIARAMCTRPRLLCLDEPAAGLNPKESAGLTNLINDIRTQEKITVLLIEHDMNVVMNLSDKIIVLDHGNLIATGTPEEIKNNSAVIRAYLGEPDA